MSSAIFFKRGKTVAIERWLKSKMLFHILYSLRKLQQVVYILDQVKSLEAELLLRIKQQGLNVKPQILVVSFMQKE